MVAIKSLAIFLAGLAPSALALPASSSSSVQEPSLAKRDDLCGVSTFARVDRAAPVADCEGLFPQIVDINHDFAGGNARLFQNGACSIWIGSEVPVSFGGQDISDILGVAIVEYTVDGLTGANGNVGCVGGTLSWTIGL